MFLINHIYIVQFVHCNNLSIVFAYLLLLFVVVFV